MANYRTGLYPFSEGGFWIMIQFSFRILLSIVEKRKLLPFSNKTNMHFDLLFNHLLGIPEDCPNSIKNL